MKAPRPGWKEAESPEGNRVVKKHCARTGARSFVRSLFRHLKMRERTQGSGCSGPRLAVGLGSVVGKPPGHFLPRLEGQRTGHGLTDSRTQSRLMVTNK